MGNRELLLQRLAATVRPDEARVPAFVLTNPDVYQLELEKLFQRAWLFLAHESELSEPGDFVSREMGEQPVIVSRAEDGSIHALLNVCRHRAMRVVRTDQGNARRFTCPYHGFTYALSLIHI